jgi:acetyl esterase/lipase
MRILTVCVFTLVVTLLSAQQWVDTVYAIQTFSNIPYGTAADFAGNQRTLMLDLSLPTDDQPPACGRPLMIVIHGGAFLAGRKEDPSPSRIRADFAKRGYVAASIQYRLGQFQTDLQVHCNASGPDLEWDCLNMTDTSEWYRAYYRGIQDVHGAIRYLANHSNVYQINPENVFIIGESAGGFIAMGVGFIDDQSEVLTDLTGAFPDAPLPHQIYEGPCIQNAPYHLDTSLASLELSRPDLGDFRGILNFPPEHEIRIKGVGNLFGAVFNNIFATTTGVPPALYLFHQPADLIVPFNSNKILQGYAVCATGFPFNCQLIINRPQVHGSNRIRQMIEDIAIGGGLAPEFYSDFTQNTAGCAEQILNPSTGGHMLDNYTLRMGHLATFFAEQIDSCGVVSTSRASPSEHFSIYPNPTRTGEPITIPGPWQRGDVLTIHDVHGALLFRSEAVIPDSPFVIPAELLVCTGVYFVRIQAAHRQVVQRIIVHHID